MTTRYRCGMSPVRTLTERGLLLGLVTVVSLLFLWMIADFLMPIFFAVVLAILFRPIYESIARQMPGFEAIASGLTLLIAIAIVALPSYILGSILTAQAIDLYQSAASDPGVLIERVLATPPAQFLAARGIELGSLRTDVVSAAQALAASVFGTAAAFTSGTISFAVKLLIAIYLMFFFVKDGPQLVSIGSRYFPLPDAQERILLDRFASTVRAVVKGGLIVALAQGFAGGVLFWISGVPQPALWGAVMAFFALIPLVGPAIVWVPAALLLFVAGDVWQAVVVAAGGTVLVGTIDNVLRPLLVGRDTAMPDALVFLSVLGGLSVFGAGGIIAGPVVAALFLSVWGLLGESGSCR